LLFERRVLSAVFMNVGTIRRRNGVKNEMALKNGSRILSAYHLPNGVKVWIITEAEDDDGKRVASTLLLPEEY
jgi:hypothetical protein